MEPQSPNSPSFLQRCYYWQDTLDPAFLLASDAEIRNRMKTPEETVSQDKVVAAQRLLQVSVHPNTGDLIPTFFRANAYQILAGPLVVATLMPHRGALSAFISQLFFQTYTAGFTVMNRNLSVKPQNVLSQHPLYMCSSVLYVACVGATPLYITKKLNLSGPSAQNFVGRILAPPLFALLGGLNVYFMRYSERDEGIQVVDGAGNVVGVSQKAGKKAVKETALSRAFLCGVTALFPSLVRRSPPMLRNPGVFNILKLMIGFLAFEIMTPISFGIFPLQGKIKREDLEDELKEKTSDSELFYHRGL